MKKIIFENLPSTNTPINSTNLNQVQNNIENVFNGKESMGSIVVEDVTCKNKFNKNTAINGYALLSATGELNKIDGWCASEYIPVKAGDKITISGKDSAGSGNCFYDVNKNFLQTITAISGTITVPDNASYLRVNLKLEDKDTCQVEKGSVATGYVEHKEFDNIAVDASIDELLSFPNGFYSPESSIKRIGNHYFGYVTIAKESKFTEAQETVATLKKRLNYSINMYGVGGKNASDIWVIPSGLTYIYISNAGLYAKAPTDFEYVKFYLDITIE